MRSSIRAILLVFLAVHSLGAEEFQHPSANYQVEIPTSWEKRVTSGVLLVSTPDGLKLRVEYELTAESLDEEAVQRGFRADGRRLKASFGAVRISRRPELSKADELGGVPTYRYGIQYKPQSRSVHAAEGYIASGTSLWPRKELQIKILVYGSLTAFQRSREGLESFLDSFTWPHVAGTEPATRRPRRPAEADLPAIPEVPTQVAVAPPPIREPIRSPGQVDTAGVGETGEGSFNRGSESGGSRLFRNAYRSQDQQWNRQVQEAFGAKDRERTEAEQAASAARMGFRED